MPVFWKTKTDFCPNFCKHQHSAYRKLSTYESDFYV